MSRDLTEREAFRKLADVAIEAAEADDVFVRLSESAGGTTRFANNQVIQNVNTHERTLTVSAGFGQQSGSASTSELTPEAVRDAVRRAEEIARLAPADPEYLAPLGEQMYPVLPTWREETAAAGPERLLRDVRHVVERCAAEGLEGAGIVEAYASVVGLAANTGLFAFEPRTQAEFSLTATASDSTGWVNNANRSIDDLGVAERTEIAIEKAKRSAGPREIPAGRYTVILEPAAVAGLCGPLRWAVNAKSYDRGTSPLSGKLGTQVIDRRLTLQNRPDHPALLAGGFDWSGLPNDYRVWIEDGVLRQLDYDRFTAKEKGVEPSPGLNAPVLSGEGAAGPRTEDLIAGTERGVLVTNFWYIRSVNPTDLTLTGMTRDGTFLIENGRLTEGLINFRFHDSPLRALRAVEAFTEPQDAITMERGKMFLPALKIRDFNFSSVTKF